MISRKIENGKEAPAGRFWGVMSSRRQSRSAVRLAGGRFLSNRTATTRVPGSATAWLPVFVDADPSVLPMIGLEIALEADGQGGFDAIVRGGIPYASLIAEAHRAILQLVKNNPGDHIGFMNIVDLAPTDWMVTAAELADNTLLQALLTPQLTLYGEPVFSVVFQVHLSPCAEGRCNDAAPRERCGDRVRDGDESDIDCGGSCRACTAGFACSAGTDCESGTCDAGTCAPGTCDDGVRDAFEIDTDCGTYCGRGCAVGDRCFSNADCATGQCGEPFVCPPDSWFCIDFPSYGTCQEPR